MGDDLDEIQEDTTSMEEKIEAINNLKNTNRSHLPRTAWKPGQSGNPNGRPPKGTAVTDVMRQMLDEKPEIKKALMTKLLEMALKGDLPAIREVLDRLEGRAKQSVELSGDEQNPLVVIKHERDKPVQVADDSN